MPTTTETTGSSTIVAGNDTSSEPGLERELLAEHAERGGRRQRVDLPVAERREQVVAEVVDDRLRERRREADARARRRSRRPAPGGGRSPIVPTAIAITTTELATHDRRQPVAERRGVVAALGVRGEQEHRERRAQRAGPADLAAGDRPRRSSGRRAGARRRAS